MYTKKVHGKRLLKMLQTKKEPCICCPATKRFVFKNDWVKECDGMRSLEMCKICQTFVGVETNDCPCTYFGVNEAIRISWEMLKDKGFCK